MSSPAVNSTLPRNFQTPIAFLSEDGAQLYAIQTYVAIGSLGALIWDIILHLPQDFKLATQHKINFPFIVYCISRISCLAYLLAFVVVSTAPINDCSMVRKLTFIYTIAIPSTLLLFVFRVCALYHNRRYAVMFFCSVWLGLLASSIIMPFGVSAYKIPLTGYCIEIKTSFAYTLIDISPFVHDTIIFLATSWAFISNSSAYQDMSLKNGLRVLLFGKFLPAFSKSILRDGQLYYLSTLLFNIVVIISYHLRYPWLSNCTFGFPLFVLMNTLAAHIYRNIRFNIYMDQTITSSVINKNLMRAATSGNTTPTTCPVPRPSSSSSSPTSNNRHVLDNIFRRSATIATTTETDARRHSSLSIEEISIQGDDGQRESEKQEDKV